MSAIDKLDTLPYEHNSNCHAIKLNWKWQHPLFAPSHLDLWYRFCCVFDSLLQFHLHTFRILHLCNRNVSSFSIVEQPHNRCFFRCCALDFKLKIIHTSLFNRSVQWSIDPLLSDALCECNFGVCVKYGFMFGEDLLRVISATSYGQRIDSIVCMLIRSYFGNSKSHTLFAFVVLLATGTRILVWCGAFRVQ